MSLDEQPSVKLFLQGPPGVGKTTLVGRVVQLLRERDVMVGGFVTRELREHGKRVGFAVRDLAGRNEEIVAHHDFTTDVRVGRYGVDVAGFERVALPVIAAALERDQVVVIDEIARMELASSQFVRALDKVLSGQVQLVATLHVHHHPVTERLLLMSGVEVIQVTEQSRDELPTQVVARLGYAVS